MEHAYFERSGEMPPYAEVVKVAEGLGMDNGTGTISRVEREALPGNEDLADHTDDVVTSPSILCPVSEDKEGKKLTDDGCGDGRGVARTFSKDGEFTHSLNRAKVFGGGLGMTAGARIGTGKAAGRSLQETMQDSIAELAEKEMDFGGHTDNHATEQNCGCGALDKADLIVEAVVTFKDAIAQTIQSLDVSTHHLPEIISNYAAYADQIKDDEYSGRETMRGVIDSGKIVKELADDHRETRIVLNFIEGMTIDQEYVRDATDNRAQVFGVDVWRMQQIANQLNTDERGAVDTVAAEKAFLSELVYTLATAAVLTKGDLPVYAVQIANKENFALAA